MVKIYTSYFYQIRNFTPDIVPLSTALYPPDWYTDKNGLPFLDKRGIWNGFQAKCFAPEFHSGCSSECDKNPEACEFMTKYYEQLKRLNFTDIMNRFEAFEEYLIDILKVKYPSVCLMVYEAPTNKCSEREILHKWFKENNYPIEEWKNGI